MAQSASVSAPLNVFPPQPSLFDLLASDNLLQTTRPALKKLVQCLASLPGGGGGRAGELMRWVTRWGDEVTLLLELCLHYYYLKRHGASFAENFYGLRRTCTREGAPVSVCNRSAVLKSLLVVVVLPYAKKKMAELYERLTRMKEDGELDTIKGKQFIDAFLAVYPILTVCSQSASFAYQFLYALGKSRFHDPFEHLMGFHLTYAPPPPPRLPLPSSFNNDSLVKSSLNGLLRMSSRLATHAFSVGLFFAQFFDVFDAEGRSRSNGDGDQVSDPTFSSSMIDEYSHRILKRLDTLIAPPKMAIPNSRSRIESFSSIDDASINASYVNDPTMSSSSSHLHSSLASAPTTSSNPIPFNVASSSSGGLFSTSGSLCPICRKTRQNETALSVSGFVFCQKCIVDYLKIHGVCPVTKLPAKTSNLVRLYPGF